MIRSLPALLLLLPLAARAEDPKEVDAATGREIRYTERQELTEDMFADLGLTGELVGPRLVDFTERQRARFNPLIHLRRDFTPEMAASVDDVK